MVMGLELEILEIEKSLWWWVVVASLILMSA